jgi:hypothetical protein
MVRKYINLRMRGDAYEVLRRSRWILARADQEERLDRARKFWGLKALYACREAFALDEKINSSFMSRSGLDQIRKRQKFIETELKRIAGDCS